jgi:DNA-directed RNA polymerase subunit RPC12/RpoP
MDLFAITCTTCKSRLRVREEGAIGQILACPKCGGMVMVKPPPNWSAGTAAKMDEPTISEVVSAGPPVDATIGASAFEAVEDLLSDAPPRMHTPPAAAAMATVAALPPPAAKPRFVGGPPAVAATPAPKPAANGDAAALAPPPPAEANAAQAVLDKPPLQIRYWALMAGSVAVGILLAIGAVSAAMYFSRTTKPPIAQANPSHPPNGTAPQTPAKSPGTKTTPVAVTPTSPIESTPDQTPVPTPAPPTSPMPMPAGTTDPVGIVQPPQPVPAPSGAPDPLAKFDKLIGGNSEQPETVPAATPPPAAAPPATPSRPALPRPAPRDVDVAKRLADPLAGIETPGTPLADFLDRFSDLTTIPITLQSDALPIFQRTPESPVVLNVQNTTTGGALAQALGALGLESVPVEGQLLVRIAEPPALRTIDYPIKDLVAPEDDQMQELAALLKALIEPASWGDAPEQGAITLSKAKQALSIRQRWAVHAPLIFLCEKLRTARGKSPVSTRFSPDLFKLDTRTALAQPKLQTPISLNFSQPARLTVVLDRLGEAAGVRILVDWQAAGAIGWNPDAEATLVASKQPLGEALDALLGPMELTWRVVDGRTLEVLTPARLAERSEVELYATADLLGGDRAGEALLAKIQQTLGPANFRADGGSGELRIDQVSKCLIAALPQPKQRELEALLAKLRSDK